MLGAHRLVCGDAKSETAMQLLMGPDRADMVFCDPPYNLRIEGVVTGRGKARHREFVEASGELTSTEFTDFLRTSLERMADACRDGAILFVCMDWRHIAGLWDRCETSDCRVVESFTIVTQPSGAPLNAYHDRAPVVIWAADRERWLTPGAEVGDLIGPESVDLFDVRPAVVS